MHAAVTSEYATKQQEQHTLKQKKHIHTLIYTQICAHKLTLRDRFTLSAHFFWDEDLTETQMVYGQYHSKKKRNLLFNIHERL